MANRRLPFFWCLTIISVSTLVMAVLSYELPVVGTPLAVLAYAITYGVVTPYFYYVAIDSFIHRNSEVTREELCGLLKKSFRTEIEVANEKRPI